MTPLTSADVAALVVVAVAIPASAVLAITDTVLTQVTRARMEALAEEQPNDRAVRALQRLLDQRDESLHPVLLLELAFDVLAASLFTLVGYRVAGSGNGWAVLLALLAFVPIMFLLAASVPRAWALHNLDRAVRVAGPVGMGVRRLWPVRMVAHGALALARRLFPRGEHLPLGELGDQSFAALAGSPSESDRIDLGGRNLLASVIDFGATVVREIMVPRPDMVALDGALSLDEAVTRVRAEGYSRYPVTGGSIDDVIGVLYAKDLAEAALSGRADRSLDGLVRPARFVPELKPVATLLRELQQEKLHLVVVVDEYGGTAGLVTMEDIIEELVGDIEDEFDDGRPCIEHLADGTTRIEARLSLDEVNDELDLDLPEGDWETLGGLVIDHFGAIPQVGDVARFGDHVLEVIAMRGRRIVTLVLRSQPSAEGPDSAGERATAEEGSA